ncbi:MAG: GTPase Era [Nitrospirae bacterium GWC2_42_7]|nr:MAG: GTPase Era [Nitrospirae bacterium GWC2_42_7]
MQKSFRSGYVSLIGKPNVGKSTLLNLFLGQKISIVTEKPQTTRNRILGIKTLEDAQILFIDTPGIHRPKHMLGEAMVRTATNTLNEIDLIVFVTEAELPAMPDKEIIGLLKNFNKPVILAINKIDKAKKSELLTIIDEYGKLFPFKEIVPLSARKQDGTDELLGSIMKYLPEGPKFYPDEQITDQIERFMAAEIIREKIMEKTSEEIPHSVAVEIVDWKQREDGLVSISTNIYVEREGQKGIIIGGKGKMLKLIGSLSRVDIERMLGTKVFLEIRVKVRKGWRDDKKALSEMGYF